MTREGKDYEELLGIVEKKLNLAYIEGLLNEVVTHAMLALVEDPKLSIEEALNTGLREWDLSIDKL